MLVQRLHKFLFLKENSVLGAKAGSSVKMVSNFASTSGDCWQRLRDQLEHSWSRVRGGNQEYLLYHLMDQTVDTLVPVVDEVLKHLAALETQLIEANSNDLNNFKIGAVHNLKQQLGFAHRMLRPMREVLNTTHSISSGEIKKYLKDIHSHINSLLEDVEAGIEQCRDLITHYDTKIANKQANVLYLLTFVTILLCPIQVVVVLVLLLRVELNMPNKSTPSTQTYMGCRCCAHTHTCATRS